MDLFFEKYSIVFSRWLIMSKLGRFMRLNDYHLSFSYIYLMTHLTWRFMFSKLTYGENKRADYWTGNHYDWIRKIIRIKTEVDWWML
jgi:hypothetical protein